MVCVCVRVHTRVCMMHVAFPPDADNVMNKINVGKV